ncbi:MAG: DNA-processing protein DprA [Muribaculaceae bacterium]|nr:DNA-processing protein DprA [Muribaculaceae bacterium]
MIIPPSRQPLSELFYRVAFSQLRGMNTGRAERLLELFGLERALFENGEEAFREVGSGRRISLSRADLDAAMDAAREELGFIEKNGIRCLYFTDDDYPRRLRACDDAPVMLYAKGDCDLNARHVVAVVGTRNATVYGAGFINRLVGDMAEKLDDLLIVSGLALGCDIMGHRRAMAAGVPTVAVVAHGLDTIYPAEHRGDAAKIARGGGAILTDYLHGTRPHRGNFLARNRIVAAISDAVVVVESAADRGGALNTARVARAYDREVFALPGRTSDRYSAGCNMLIREQTAALVESADDLIRAMGWTTRPAEGEQAELFSPLPENQQRVMDFLTHNGEASADAMQAALGIPAGQLMSLLVEMEFNDLIMALPGARYRVN